jgi:arginine-tRNA-protein transferase
MPTLKEEEPSLDPSQMSLTPNIDLPPDSLPSTYGAYHHLYYLDGKLIAFGVLDILPGGVSGVYFVWDPDWSGLGLGKVR